MLMLASCGPLWLMLPWCANALQGRVRDLVQSGVLAGQFRCTASVTVGDGNRQMLQPRCMLALYKFGLPTYIWARIARLRTQVMCQSPL